MVRLLVAVLALFAAALGAPAQAGRLDDAALQPTAMADHHGGMDDCAPLAGQDPCPVDCATCHAMAFDAPPQASLRVVFMTPDRIALRKLAGLNPTPEPRPPRG
jgi:hypothetical protein